MTHIVIFHGDGGRTNTGLVDVYVYITSPSPTPHGSNSTTTTTTTSATPSCRWVRTLAPPKRSKNVNIKVTCLRLCPTTPSSSGFYYLAIGNILGNVTIVRLEWEEGKPTSVVHEHDMHEVKVN